jgi:ankyrin repeat protein
MLEVVNKQNRAGNTALHWAALNGHLNAVKVLLEQGADPTIKNARGHDAIFEAELNDKSEIVEWVLKNGGKSLQMGIGDDGEEEKAGNEDIKFESAGDMMDSGLAQDGGAEVVDADPKVVDGIIEELGQLEVEDDKKD